MPPERNYQTEAVIIRKTKMGEADRILTLYTPDMGKLSAVAKGIRRPKARLVGHLELMNHSTVSLVRGKNLDTITGSQTINSFLPVRSDLWLSSLALYVIELINQFTVENQENRALWDLLLSTLNRLAQPSGNKELVIRFFEMHMLTLVGYRPQLQECVTCRRVLEPVVNNFCYSAGGVMCPNCGHTQGVSLPISVNALKVLRALQSDNFDTAVRLRLNPELAIEVETVIRTYIKYLLEKDIKSTIWLDTLRRQNLAYSPAALLPAQE